MTAAVATDLFVAILFGATLAALIYGAITGKGLGPTRLPNECETCGTYNSDGVWDNKSLRWHHTCEVCGRKWTRRP